MTAGAEVEDLLRRLAPRVLAALVRRHGDFEAAEDAVQEALLAAATRWPERGVPERPAGWLITVAARRLADQLRSERADRRREEKVAAWTTPDELLAPAADTGVAAAVATAAAAAAAAHADAHAGARADTAADSGVAADAGADADAGVGAGAEALRDADDTLLLLFLCCHPSLTPPSQIALTLRAVGGLTTAEIARAFLVPEATMAQRLSRARQRIKASGATFRLPPAPAPAERLRAVLHVLYLMFNEGYTATSGPDLHRADLTGEAIRLTRQVHRALPGDGEVAGLLALMLLIDARRPARTRPDGGLVPLAEQDRGRWNRASIDEGVALISRTLARARLGPYQVQAAIAAVHGEAARAEDTDWPQIVALYRLLGDLAPGPMVTLGHAVAAAMVDGPHAGLALLEPLDADDRMAGHHRLPAVRAHLLEMAGDHAAARACYRRAARLTTSLPEQRYLYERAARLDRDPP